MVPAISRPTRGSPAGHSLITPVRLRTESRITNHNFLFMVDKGFIAKYIPHHLCIFKIYFETTYKIHICLTSKYYFFMSYSQIRDFIKNGDFSRVAEYLYDHRLQQENEICLLYRVLGEVSRQGTDKALNSLEYQTLLFYISKYGFCPETEKLIFQSATTGASSDDTANLGLFREALCGLIPEYVRRRDISGPNNVLLAELQGSPGFDSPLPEYSAEDKMWFNRKYIREYTGFIRFMGICVID